MMEFLFNLIVQPIFLILEFLFDCIYDFNQNIVLTVFLISFIVSLFCLPLYIKADKLSKEETEVQKKLSKKVNDIKRNFKGDERLLLLQTYYRQNNYHPIMSLRLSLSLLLQIPIFIAAYTFFSQLSIDNMQCLFISDLSKPDGMVKIFNFSINILPILMTAINVIAGLVYAKSLKENKALIAMSLVFLILLYNSPSILTLYWLFNNVFSLIKNIILKTHGDKKTKCSFTKTNKFILPIEFNNKKLFTLSSVTLVFLLGLVIPSNVISSSPSDFTLNGANPFAILVYTFGVFAGIFIFWGSWIYYFSNNKIKKIFTLLLVIFLIVSMTNLLLFIPETNILNNIFVFEASKFIFHYSSLSKFIFLVIICSFFYQVFYFVKNKKIKLTGIVVKLILITCICTFLFNLCEIISKKDSYLTSKEEKINNEFISLSKTKKNVLIIFADRAISSFLPLIFNENPKLIEQFKGFTYYPATFSYAEYTILTYPAIMGGYEYTPFHMNYSEGVFEDKFNQGTTVLPMIFSKNNWDTTIINPINNLWGKEFKRGLSKEEINSMKKTLLENEKNIKIKVIPNSIADKLKQKADISTGTLSKRNAIYYSLLLAIPNKMRTSIYDDGFYHNPNTSKYFYYSTEFVKYYSEMYYLKDLTNFTSNNNTFTILNTNLTHAPALLKYPNYDFTSNNDENYTCPIENYVNTYTLKHYHVNMAAIRFLGDYMDYLRKNNVYDNTRIIIVADHGHGYDLQNPIMSTPLQQQIFPYNPLLMVKDFGSNHRIRTSSDLMNNADIPMIATKNIIKNPINPYTNKKITNKEKEYGIFIKADVDWQPRHYLGKTEFLSNRNSFIYIEEKPKGNINIEPDLDYKEAARLYKKKINEKQK